MERKHPANLFVCDCIIKALFKLMKSKKYTVSALVKTARLSNVVTHSELSEIMNELEKTE